MKSYEKKQLIYKFILVAVFIICVTAVITFYAASISLTGSGWKVPAIGEKSSENIEIVEESIKELRTIIDEYYIGEIDEQRLADETIKGYVNGLDDEYSEYMTADEWEDYQINTLGNYVGIGVYMTLDENDNVTVVEPIEGSPAEEAGIQAGDIIAKVNDEDISGQDISVVSGKIKGEEGTKVKLEIIRGSEYITLDVERKSIYVYHVKTEMLENDTIGYIELDAFDENCSEEFKTALEEVTESGAKKIIIDLRNNTGGLVDQAIKIADLFLEKDATIFKTKDNYDKEEVTKAPSDPIIDSDTQIVVLVNNYTASASEILVGALRDNGLAKVVGTKTYGKGVIQNVFEFKDGSILKLTTAEYVTPNGTAINKVGIEPDEVIENVPDAEGEEVDEQLNKAIEVLDQN